MNSQSTGTQLHNYPCRKCGSRNWQSIELAYLQSVRTTDHGNSSISSFGASITPPEPRSTVGGPIWSGFGFFCTGLVFIPYVAGHFVALPATPAAMFTPVVYFPSLLVGFVAFILHLGSALNYNATRWQKNCRKWQSRFVCRTCGHKTPPANGAGGRR